MGNMLTSEVARFFSRDEAFNLAEGIERNATNIATYREIVNDKNWPSMREDLEFVSKRVKHLTLRWPKDKNMGLMFYLLLQRARGMNQQDKQDSWDRSELEILTEYLTNLNEELAEQITTRHVQLGKTVAGGLSEKFRKHHNFLSFTIRSKGQDYLDTMTYVFS